MSYQPIENYGVIGDLHTVALVGIDGSIDFMCFPHFDSPSIFAAMLDAEKGGHFKLAPILNEAKHKQLYLPDTNMLLTRFLADEGVAEVSDFMPVAELRHSHQIIFAFILLLIVLSLWVWVLVCGVEVISGDLGERPYEVVCKHNRRTGLESSRI